MPTTNIEELKYDEISGHLTFNGKRIGWKNGPGYRRVKIQGKEYAEHRLIWFLMTGEFPDLDIDHINGIRDDNRWCNLRVLSRQHNLQNQRLARQGNPLLGVTKNRNRWSAKIKLNGKLVHLGTFDTPEQAHEVYINKKKKEHPGYAQYQHP